MLRAIDEYEVHGVETTLDFGHFAMNHDAFRSGQFDTGFVNDHYKPELLVRSLPCDDETMADLVPGWWINSKPRMPLKPASRA